ELRVVAVPEDADGREDDAAGEAFLVVQLDPLFGIEAGEGRALEVGHVGEVGAICLGAAKTGESAAHDDLAVDDEVFIGGHACLQFERHLRQLGERFACGLSSAADEEGANAAGFAIAAGDAAGNADRTRAELGLEVFVPEVRGFEHVGVAINDQGFRGRHGALLRVRIIRLRVGGRPYRRAAASATTSMSPQAAFWRASHSPVLSSSRIAMNETTTSIRVRHSLMMARKENLPALRRRWRKSATRSLRVRPRSRTITARGSGGVRASISAMMAQSFSRVTLPRPAPAAAMGAGARRV